MPVFSPGVQLKSDSIGCLILLTASENSLSAADSALCPLLDWSAHHKVLLFGKALSHRAVAKNFVAIEGRS